MSSQQFLTTCKTNDANKQYDLLYQNATKAVEFAIGKGEAIASYSDGCCIPLFEHAILWKLKPIHQKIMDHKDNSSFIHESNTICLELIDLLTKLSPLIKLEDLSVRLHRILGDLYSFLLRGYLKWNAGNRPSAKDQGEFNQYRAKMIQSYEKAYQESKESLSSRHHARLLTGNNFGFNLYWLLGEFERSSKILKESFDAAIERLGDRHASECLGDRHVSVIMRAQRDNLTSFVNHKEFKEKYQRNVLLFSHCKRTWKIPTPKGMDRWIVNMLTESYVESYSTWNTGLHIYRKPIFVKPKDWRECCVLVIGGFGGTIE